MVVISGSQVFWTSDLETDIKGMFFNSLFPISSKFDILSLTKRLYIMGTILQKFIFKTYHSKTKNLSTHLSCSCLKIKYQRDIDHNFITLILNRRLKVCGYLRENSSKLLTYISLKYYPFVANYPKSRYVLCGTRQGRLSNTHY